jgi:hypothetical protein
LIKQLGLTCSKKLLFIKLAREGLEDNDGLTSYLTQFEAIVILLKPQSFERLGITLAHEMVHVKQLAKGHLKNVKGVNYWNGKRYSKRTKYLNMPWEIEAFSKQELLFRRAID